MNKMTWMNWNEWTETTKLTWMICRPHGWPHLQKVVRICQVFYDFYMKPSSPYSLVHISSTSSSKSAKKPAVFDNFYVINYLITMWSTDEMKLSLQSRAHFVDLIWPHGRTHFEKVVRSCHFIYDFYMKPSSPYSLVRILSTSFAKSGKNRQFFFNEFYVKSSSRYSLVHIFSASFSINAKKLAFFGVFYVFFFLWEGTQIPERHLKTNHLKKLWINRALATVSCAFCRPLCGSRPAPAETETFQRRPRTATLPEKMEGFSPESLFSRELTHSWLLTLPNYMMMMMMMMMMMWLTWWLRWWCGCHDGETASLWQSSVTRKFPN